MVTSLSAAEVTYGVRGHPGSQKFLIHRLQRSDSVYSCLAQYMSAFQLWCLYLLFAFLTFAASSQNEFIHRLLTFHITVLSRFQFVSKKARIFSFQLGETGERKVSGWFATGTVSCPFCKFAQGVVTESRKTDPLVTSHILRQNRLRFRHNTSTGTCLLQTAAGIVVILCIT